MKNNDQLALTKSNSALANETAPLQMEQNRTAEMLHEHRNAFTATLAKPSLICLRIRTSHGPRSFVRRSECPVRAEFWDASS